MYFIYLNSKTEEVINSIKCDVTCIKHVTCRKTINTITPNNILQDCLYGDYKRIINTSKKFNIVLIVDDNTYLNNELVFYVDKMFLYRLLGKGKCKNLVSCIILTNMNYNENHNSFKKYFIKNLNEYDEDIVLCIELNGDEAIITREFPKKLQYEINYSKKI